MPICPSDGEKVKDLVTDPVTGTVDTAKVAVEGVVTAPVEAAKTE